jgi:hypothetical protein
MRSIDVTRLRPAPERTRRPAPVLVATDTAPDVVSLVEDPAGNLLVVESPRLAEPPGRLVRRDREHRTVATLEGPRGHAALSPDGRRLLATGPLWHAEHASCVLVDLDAWSIQRTLPLRPPFLWLDDARFVAQTPAWRVELRGGRLVRLDERHVDPAVAAAAPGLLGPSPALVVVDLERGAVRPLLPSLPYDPETCAVLSPERDVVYSATHYSRISAVRLSDGALLWQRPPVPSVTDGTTYALGFDPSSPRLLAVGRGPHDFLELDATDGAELSRDDVGARLRQAGLRESKALRAIATRADGLVVLGTDQGFLVERWPDGRWETYKAAGRAIESLAFTRGGAELVIGGAERNLRVLKFD